MKKFHKSQWDPNPSRLVNPGLENGYPAKRVDQCWLLRSCEYLLRIDRRRVDSLRRVEANPGLTLPKGGLSQACGCGIVDNNRFSGDGIPGSSPCRVTVHQPIIFSINDHSKYQNTGSLFSN